MINIKFKDAVGSDCYIGNKWSPNDDSSVSGNQISMGVVGSRLMRIHKDSAEIIIEELKKIIEMEIENIDEK